MTKSHAHRMRWRIVLASAVVANLALWLIPSNVVTLIARDRHALLGRYSRSHFTWIILAAVVSLIVLFLTRPDDPLRRRRRGFATLAVALALLVPTCAADLILRTRAPVYYGKDTLAYHRPAHFRAPSDGDPPLMVRDAPEAARTYPDPPAGYPEFEGRMTCDRRGFRNQTDLESYDIVVLGDSFAEGSRVSDEHPWPVRLAVLTGRTVYNLGMSGYAPQNYRATLDEIGLSLHPKFVLCMLYEENDFRAAELRDQPESESGKFFKQSPILQQLDALIVRNLGPLHATGPVRGIEVLSWLPLRVPAGETGHPYTFSPNLLLDLYQTPDALTAKRQWKAITTILAGMNATCRDAGVRFVLVYAPSKPHVLLPLAEDLSAEKVHAFAELRAKQGLPEPAAFLAELLAALDVKETLTRKFCSGNEIEFVSVTEALRHAALAGQSVYFTYDDHFSPTGHEVVARAVADFIGP